MQITVSVTQCLLIIKALNAQFRESRKYLFPVASQANSKALHFLAACICKPWSKLSVTEDVGFEALTAANVAIKCLPGYNVLQHNRSLLDIRRNAPPAYPLSKMPSKNLAKNRRQAVRSSETFVDFYQTARRYIPAAVLFMAAKLRNVHLREALGRRKNK